MKISPYLPTPDSQRPSTGNLGDGAVGFGIDGLTIKLAIARSKISRARCRVVSNAQGSFFRRLVGDLIDVALTLLNPLGPAMRRLTACIGERSFRAPLENRQAEAACITVPISNKALLNGANLVQSRALPSRQEVRVGAKDLPPQRD